MRPTTSPPEELGDYAKVARRTLGFLLILLALTGLFSFDVWISALKGLSVDGHVEPLTWLYIRILLISLVTPGILALNWDAFGRLVARGRRILEDSSQSDFLAWTLLTAAVIRLAWVEFIPHELIGDWAQYDDLGWRLARTGQYSVATHLTTFRPPGLPFLLSILYRIFGHEPKVYLLLNAAFGVGIVYLTYRLIRRLGGELQAKWAALILCFFPSQILFLNTLGTEALFTFLFLLCLNIFSTAPFGQSSGNGRLLAAGLILGLATLVRTVTILFPLVLVVSQIHVSKRRMHFLRASAALLAGTLLITIPWRLRNYVVSGSPVIATIGGAVFYTGNNPNMTFGLNALDLEKWVTESPRREVLLSRKGYAQGLAYIHEQPFSFLKRGLMKITYLAGADTEGWHYELLHDAQRGVFRWRAWVGVGIQSYYFVFLLLCLEGLWIFLRTKKLRSPGSYLFLLTLCYWFGLHFFFTAQSRYHYPIVPIMAAFAALTLTAPHRKAGS